MRGIVALVLAFAALTLPARCAGVDDPWHSLMRLPGVVDFAFVERDRTCHHGRIKAVTDQSVVVRTDRSDVTIEKSSLIRVRCSNSNDLVLATVYSGRSSWADVVDFTPFESNLQFSLKVRMSATTIAGKLRRGSLEEVTSTRITLADALGKEISIPKTEVSRIEYIREKPLSDKQEFYWDELAMGRIFDPKLYPRLFHLGDTIHVRLYDRAIPEDNSPLQCK